MGLSAAEISVGMATRHKRAVMAMQDNLGQINALLKRIIDGGRVEYGAYGENMDWYVRKLNETASWNTGHLGTRTFEEREPVDEATLPICFVDETYGVGEKSLKTNRALGEKQIYKIQYENARPAEQAVYNAIVAAIYSRGTSAYEPHGLRKMAGDPYESSNAVAISAASSYAGITYNTSAISAWAANKASFDQTYWAPEVMGIHEITNDAGDKWSTDCLSGIEFMALQMYRTKNVSGTGEVISPDLGLMNRDPYAALVALVQASQSTYNIPMGAKDLTIAGFKTINVHGVDCVLDTSVPTDADKGGSGYEMVFIIDSKAFRVHTCNTKKEGLVEGQWTNDRPDVIGGVGVFKSNMCITVDTPLAVGCFVGCND